MARKHDSPVVQFFLGFGSKSGVAVADYREARDLLLRREDVAHGPLNCDPWLGLIPGNFIAMESEQPSFKPTKSLVKGLMTPTFLNLVSMHPTSQFMSIYATDSMPALVSVLAS